MYLLVNRISAVKMATSNIVNREREVMHSTQWNYFVHILKRVSQVHLWRILNFFYRNRRRNVNEYKSNIHLSGLKMHLAVGWRVFMHFSIKGFKCIQRYISQRGREFHALHYNGFKLIPKCFRQLVKRMWLYLSRVCILSQHFAHEAKTSCVRY